MRGTGVGRRFGRPNRPRQDVTWERQRTSLVTLKMNDQCANVHENKGGWYGAGGEKKKCWGLERTGQRPARRRRQSVTRAKMTLRLKEKILFLTEQCGNVSENKGSLGLPYPHDSREIETKSTASPTLVVPSRHRNGGYGKPHPYQGLRSEHGFACCILTHLKSTLEGLCIC